MTPRTVVEAGSALSTVVRTEGAAAPVVRAVVLPLLFISGVFIPGDAIPSGLPAVADLFPIRHLTLALLEGYDPVAGGSGFAPGHLAVVLAWGVAGVLVAARRFQWVPQGRRPTE